MGLARSVSEVSDAPRTHAAGAVPGARRSGPAASGVAGASQGDGTVLGTDRTTQGKRDRTAMVAGRSSAPVCVGACGARGSWRRLPKSCSRKRRRPVASGASMCPTVLPRNEAKHLS